LAAKTDKAVGGLKRGLDIKAYALSPAFISSHLSKEQTIVQELD